MCCPKQNIVETYIQYSYDSILRALCNIRLKENKDNSLNQ